RYHRDTEFHRHQAGDPVKAAQVLLKLVAADNPPVHLLLGSDALRLVREKIGSLNGEIEAWETYLSQPTSPERMIVDQRDGDPPTCEQDLAAGRCVCHGAASLPRKFPCFLLILQ